MNELRERMNDLCVKEPICAENGEKDWVDRAIRVGSVITVCNIYKELLAQDSAGIKTYDGIHPVIFSNMMLAPDQSWAIAVDKFCKKIVYYVKDDKSLTSLASTIGVAI